MKKIIFVLLMACGTAFAQNGFRLQNVIETGCDMFTTDNQGNIYVVKNDELFKFSREGKQLYKYSSKNYGKISGVDASNMMRILVFYREFSQAVFLDNTLSLNGEAISFDKLGFPQVSVACNSFNGGLWIFDQQNTSLLQLGPDYAVAQRTENLSALLNMQLQPKSILEHDNLVYLNDTLSGILVFDIYGNYFKTIPAKGAKDFQAIRDWIYYLKDGEVKAYNLKTTEDVVFDLPEKNVKAFRLEMETLVIQNEKGLAVYTPR